jgi:AcrR family transcriptional regulator
MNRKTSRPAPGRPAGSEPDTVRRALLHAAAECFLARPFAAVTIRQLAETAGVNPAMIHYYFGSKANLYIALFEETVGPILERLTEAVSAGEDLDTVIGLYLHTLGENPWIPTLLLRDVLSGTSTLQEKFTERIAARAGGLIRTLVAHAQEQGRIREEVDPRLAALSLISLCVFPLVAAPVASRALNLKYDRTFIETLIEHNIRVLREGIYR